VEALDAAAPDVRIIGFAAPYCNSLPWGVVDPRAYHPGGQFARPEVSSTVTYQILGVAHGLIQECNSYSENKLQDRVGLTRAVELKLGTRFFNKPLVVIKVAC